METPGESIDDESRSPTNPGIGGPDPVMAAYLSELGIWLGLRNVKLPKDKKQGVQLALEVQGPRPIRPDITVSDAALEWDWLADKVGFEKAFCKLGNRPCQKDYPKHDEHLPNRLPTTLNKAAGQKNPTETNTASANAVEDSPKEYLPKSQDVLDALTEIEAEDADPKLIAQETSDQVDKAFGGFGLDEEVVHAEQPEVMATSDTLPFADPFAATTPRTPIEAPLADTSDESDPFDREVIVPAASATDNGPDLTSNGEVTRAFNNLVLPGSGLNGDLDREEEKLFDSRVVSAPEQFPSRVPATPQDMTLLRAAMEERLPPQPSLPREFAQMMTPRGPTDLTDAAPPPPKAMEVAARPTIPIRRPGGPTTTDGLELTPPEAQPAAKASRSAIVNHIGIGLGVIGLMFFLGTLIVRRTPTTTTVRPTVCVSPGLQRSLPTEAQRNFFPCRQRTGAEPMFYCSITAAPSAEERAGFCRTIRASCVPPIGQSVTTSEQEACLADPTRSPINH